MEENKNLEIEKDQNAQTNEISFDSEVDETVVEEIDAVPKKKKGNIFKKNSDKPKKIRNQAFLKKGSYSLALTAIVIAGVIVLNILVGVLTDRLDINYDFTTDKSNSLSAENKKYLKGIKNDVSVIFCGTEESYASYVAQTTASNNDVASDASDYYEQTVRIVKKYASYNNKIDIKFMDTESSEFAAIASEYPDDQLNYGDIIVSCTKNGNKRYRIIGFTDIYELTEDQTYAQYGYTAYNVSGNNIETALTSAIAYTQSNKNKKIALINGHSKADRTTAYQQLLKDNNYDMEVIDDKYISSIDDSFDAVAIFAPSYDFTADELDIISDFLDNDGKLNKGLVVYLDAVSPYLTNFYEFLESYGITAEDGIVFETDSNCHLTDDPSTMISFSTGSDDITKNIYYCLSGYNVPMTAAFEERDGIKVSSLVSTSDTDVAVPKSTPVDTTDFSNYEQKSYSTVIQSEIYDYDSDSLEKFSSYVTVFSSCDFLDSEYNETGKISNKDVDLAVAERACGAEKSEISFVAKTIADETYADSITDASVNIVRIIFMGIIPLAIIVAGIYIYIKRRNA